MGLDMHWPSGIQGAMLFTDAQNHVIFADRSFLALTRREAAGVIGKPLHEVLGVEVDAVQQMIDSITQNGSIRDWLLTIQPNPDVVLDVGCTGRAAHDEQGGFIGANIQLRGHAETDQSEAASKPAPMTPQEATLQLYFTEHLLALQIMVMRLLGGRMRSRMEEKLNTLAGKNGWPMAITDGNVTINLPGLSLEAYRTLLGEAAAFAAELVGSRLVAREVELVDGHIDPAAIEAATRAGLRESPDSDGPAAGSETAPGVSPA